MSIIGSAGRRGDAKKMTKDLYWNMVDKSQRVISEHFKLDAEHVHLVSGGAAWAGEFDLQKLCHFECKLYFADHIAVTLYLQEKAAALTLHVPAAWESTGDGYRFIDNRKPSQSNPGRVANKLHKTFGEKVNEETLRQIDSCKHLGATLQVHDGFKKRNDYVARSDYLIAFSWSDGEEPTKGGTMDTWSKCTGKKLHIPLSSLENYTRQIVGEEPSIGLKREKLLEICDSPPATQAEQPRPQPSPTHTSHELPPSCTSVNLPPSCEHNSLNSGVESLDSGVGSIDSSQSSSMSAETESFQANRKRRRSESTDISDDSDLECDRVGNTTKICTQQSNSKKLKLSEFAKQALSS